MRKNRPVLRRALVRGEMGFCMAQVIAGVTRAEDEERWVEEARRRTVRELFILKDTSDGALPIGGLILDMDANLRHRLSADVLESMALLLRERSAQGRLAP